MLLSGHSLLRKLTLGTAGALLCAAALAQTEPAPDAKSLPATAPGMAVQPAEAPKLELAISPKLRLGAGDLIDISVYGAPDLNQKARVTNSGEVYLPLVGYIRVDGLTIEEAQAAIEKRLVEGNFLKAPHVTVFISEYATQGASIMGEVQRSGIYPVLGSRRLFDLVAAAGGLTQKAGKTVSITHRDQSQVSATVVLSNDPAKSAAANVQVFPGDTIVVSKAGIIYVVGDVAHPSGFIMENNESLTVLQALALAGGNNSHASLDNAKLIRRTANGPTEVPIPLKKILSAQAADVNMQPEDILFVPASK
ncbi:MAG: polysaccharide biosynthesis/export family protein, partial [Terriglobales bacterium]